MIDNDLLGQYYRYAPMAAPSSPDWARRKARKALSPLPLATSGVPAAF